MRRTLPVLVALLCVAASARAGESGGYGRPVRTRWHLWKVPVYLVVGLPRDLIDAPVKGLSSVPVVNRVLIPPLALANAVTAAASWSFTDEGMEGGFRAWLACERFRRAKGRERPEWMRDRPWWRNYAPNFRSFGVITREPVTGPGVPR